MNERMKCPHCGGCGEVDVEADYRTTAAEPRDSAHLAKERADMPAPRGDSLWRRLTFLALVVGGVVLPVWAWFAWFPETNRRAAGLVLDLVLALVVALFRAGAEFLRPWSRRLNILSVVYWYVTLPLVACWLAMEFVRIIPLLLGWFGRKCARLGIQFGRWLLFGQAWPKPATSPTAAREAAALPAPVARRRRFARGPSGARIRRVFPTLPGSR